jgi:hypothetical protein
MINSILYKLLKYLALSATVYLVFRFVPNQSINNVDTLVVTAIIILAYILFENLCALYTSEESYLSQTEKFEICSSVCSVKKEGMENVINADTHAIINPIAAQEAVGIKTAGEIKDIKEHRENKIVEQDKIKDKVDKNITYESVSKFNADNGIERIGSRAKDDTMNDESEYSDDYNHLPLGQNYNTGDFEYGYAFLPPEKWYPQPPVPPVCVAEKKCAVCPVLTMGGPVDLKEWNDSRRITPPDNINTKFIKEKLNSGR